MRNILLGFEFILAAVIIVVVLLQPSKADGIKGFITGNSETFFSKNKSRTKEAMLARITVVSAILFAITTIALNIVK